MAEGDRPTRASLEAMYEKHAAGARRGPGLPHSLDDHIKHAQIAHREGVVPEDWAPVLGVPVEYARALIRYVSGADGNAEE